jgi:hypothetical protein
MNPPETKESKRLRNDLVEEIGLAMGWEESAVTLVDNTIMPVIARHPAPSAMSDKETVAELIEVILGVYHKTHLTASAQRHSMLMAALKFLECRQPEIDRLRAALAQAREALKLCRPEHVTRQALAAIEHLNTPLFDGVNTVEKES